MNLIEKLNPSSDNYLSDTHFLTHLNNLKSEQVQDFFTIDITNYTIKLPKIKKSNLNTIIIPIRIISFNNLYGVIGHTNVVVYNVLTCTINLFEPHGKEFMGYNPLKIDISGIIHYYINELLNVKATLCKISGLQGKQNYVYPNTGHCTAWALLFVEFKDLTFLDQKDPTFLDNFIRKYITFVKKSFSKGAPVSKTNLGVNNELIINYIKININNELIINHIKYLFDLYHYKCNSLICKELVSFKYYYTELFNNIKYQHPKPFNLF